MQRDRGRPCVLQGELTLCCAQSEGTCEVLKERERIEECILPILGRFLGKTSLCKRMNHSRVYMDSVVQVWFVLVIALVQRYSAQHSKFDKMF